MIRFLVSRVDGTLAPERHPVDFDPAVVPTPDRDEGFAEAVRDPVLPRAAGNPS